MERFSKNTVMLTIAVPVYNVEKYLNRCLESLVKQDYLDKEILIINDGSKDESMEIVRTYAEKYPFVRYIDQPNAGLAAVRNRCIREAKGEYISFIDSDDYVLEGIYSHLMPYIKSNEIDIMCYGVVNLYENREQSEQLKNVNNCPEVINRFTSKEALDEFFLPNNIDVITCNKIIRKKLYEGILYPVGKLYEDMFTNYKVIAKADKIASTNYQYYVYCHRETSIGGMKYNEKTMDLYRAITEAYEYIKESGLENPRQLNVGYATWLLVVLNIMIRSQYEDVEYKRIVRTFIRGHVKEINKSSYLNLTRKIQMNLLIMCYPLYKVAYKKYLEKFRA